MKRLNFCSYEDFAMSVSEVFDEISVENKYNELSIIAKYEDAKKIIEDLVHCDYSLCSIDINYDYSNEYIVYLSCADKCGEIWCEPMNRDNGYIYDGSKVIYVLDNCSSNVLKYLDSDYIYEVHINDDDEECDGNCDDCEYGKDEVSSVTTNNSHERYLVNGKLVDKETYEKNEKEIYEQMDRVKKIFHKYDVTTLDALDLFSVFFRLL